MLATHEDGAEQGGLGELLGAGFFWVSGGVITNTMRCNLSPSSPESRSVQAELC